MLWASLLRANWLWKWQERILPYRSPLVPLNLSFLAPTTMKRSLAGSRDPSHTPPFCISFLPLLKVSLKPGKVPRSPKSPMAGSQYQFSHMVWGWNWYQQLTSYSAAIAGAVLIPGACKGESCGLATRQAWVHGSRHCFFRGHSNWEHLQFTEQGFSQVWWQQTLCSLPGALYVTICDIMGM